MREEKRNQRYRSAATSCSHLKSKPNILSLEGKARPIIVFLKQGEKDLCPEGLQNRDPHWHHHQAQLLLFCLQLFKGLFCMIGGLGFESKFVTSASSCVRIKGSLLSLHRERGAWPLKPYPFSLRSFDISQRKKKA